MLRIGIIGYGNMGQALHRSWLGTSHAFHIISPHIADKDTPDGANNHYYTAAGEFLKNCDQIWFCVKPQIMEQVCTDLKSLVNPETLVVSVAAGQTLDHFASYFGNAQPVIRVMPNTPAAVQKGVQIMIANTHATSAHKNEAEELCAAAGHACWLTDESQMNAAAAIASSGPAYLFYFIEMLTKSATTAGLPQNLAETLARQTIIGSAALAESQPETPATTLRENVTSKGGVTAEALKHMMDGRWQAVMDEAIAANIRKNEELG